MKRRVFLKGLGGVSLMLPHLEISAKGNSIPNPRRFVALYTANGMSLPKPEFGINEWGFFPKQNAGQSFVLGASTQPLTPFQNQISFLGGLHHPNGPKADPHICSDMWLTGAPLHNPKPGTFNTVSLDQVIAQHTKQYCRIPSLVLSIDAGTGFLSRTGTISYNIDGKPIPAENNPRRIFNRLFTTNQDTVSQRHKLQHRIKLVDAVNESAKDFYHQLGRVDKDKVDQYLTSLNELESRMIVSERWLDIPIKKQNYSQLNLEVTNETQHPAEYYQVMYDLIALALDADITRSVTFMLNREDGMGISDTFPLKLGLSRTHHNLSHAVDLEGQKQFAQYDQFLCTQLAYFLKRLQNFQESSGTVLDNTIVLYGSGASTTHNNYNLPTLIAGGANLSLKQGQYWRQDRVRMSNLYLSILQSLAVETDQFADSTGTLSNSIFK